MRSIISIISIVVSMIFCLSVSATNYYVEIHEGLGAGTGDKGQYIDLPDDPLPNQDNNNNSDNKNSKTKKSSSSIISKDSVTIDVYTFIISPEGLFFIDENIKVTDTAKDPIDWTPYIIWGIIITTLGLLIWGGWYIYQIYFY